MTDKKIIIDGVDVSECEYQNYGHCEIDYDEWNGEIIRYNKCQDNPNCHFKQLKRKEQECEEINLTNERLIAEKYVMNEGILKYKQALDEIEKFCDKILADILHYSQGTINTAEKIRNIINKAKDNIND